MRHNEWVNCLAFSPNGKIVASGSWDRTVRLWDARTGRELACLRGHRDRLLDLAFSLDGRLLASASQDKTVKLWDVASRRAVATLYGHKNWVGAVAFSPDGRLVASGSYLDSTVKLWDVRSRRVVATLKGCRGWHNSVLFSPDGKTLVWSNPTNTVSLWDVASRREVGLLKGHKSYVSHMAFSPDGRVLATAAEQGDTPVKLWDVGARREIATLYTGWVWGVAFSPDGKTLATSGVDSTIKLWDVALRQVVTTLTGHTAPIDAVAFSPDGNTLASASADKSVRLWRTVTLEEADVAPVSAFSGTGSDRSVALQWRPVPHAVAYQLYRGPAHAPPARLVKLTPRPITGSSFTDHDANMVNGRPQTYGVAAVFRGARSASIEGPMEILQASPVAAPPGFLGSSINEGAQSGSARFQPATGVIAVRGSGRDIWDRADGFYFLNQPVTGDFQITVRSLNRPTKTNEWAKAGLMVRESLDAGARNVYLVTTPVHGMQRTWRATTDDNSSASNVISHAALKLPILLRLIRRENTITAEYSRDEGRSFQPAGQPLSFNPPLANTVYAGLAITAHDESKVSEAKFSGLEIRKR